MVQLEQDEKKCSFERQTAECVNQISRFTNKSNYLKQFANLYMSRIEELSLILTEKAKAKWGLDVDLIPLSELEEQNGKRCAVIGTLYKHQVNKPSILQELSEEHQMSLPSAKEDYCSDEDKLYLEDQTSRIRLDGDKVNVKESVTGVVCAVIGSENEKSTFQVEDWCFAGCPLQKTISSNPLFAGKLIFLSGLELATMQSDLALSLFVEWISGLAGNTGTQKDKTSIVRLIIAGNSIKGCADQHLSKGLLGGKTEEETAAKTMTTGTQKLDSLLETVGSNCCITIMPGQYDITTFMMPQKAMHPISFPKSKRLKSIVGVTNPWIGKLSDRLIIGTSGQPILDMQKVCGLNTLQSLEFLERSLEWRHLCPTAPDTIPCVPFYENDPFIIKECPDIYFAGNMDKFETKLYKGNEGQTVRLICIPKFADTQSVILVDLETLEPMEISFGAEEDENVENRTYGCLSHCPGQYTFDDTHGYETVAMEWKLICERETLLKLSGDLYYIGLMLGGLVAGPIADRIGRLPVLAISLYAQGTMAVALNVVQEYQLFLVFRGLQGFFIQGLESCTFVLCMELFPTKFRTLVALIILSIRSLGLALLSGLSYSILDWRILQLVISVPTAITVLYIWIVPESPRWLLAKGKSMEAEMLLERIANYNMLCGTKEKNDDPEKSTDREKPQKPKRKSRGCANSTQDVEKSFQESKNLLSQTQVTAQGKNDDRGTEEVSGKNDNSAIEPNIEEIAKTSMVVVNDVKNKTTDDKGGSYVLVSSDPPTNNEIVAEKKIVNNSGIVKFLKSKFIGRISIIMMCLWFTSSMAFHGLVSLPHRPNTERHVSLTLAAGMEVAAFLVTFLLVSSRCGRRWPLCLSQLIVGMACLTLAVFAQIYQQSSIPSWLAHARTGIVLVGRLANIGSFFILRLVVIELFPTISRGTGVGLCIGAEMIGGLLTPYILILNNYVFGLPRFLIGFFCVCTGFLTLIFPETLRTILPDSVEEARNLGHKRLERSNNPQVLREKLFSEDWVDAGNGIIVNFTDNTNPE